MEDVILSGSPSDKPYDLNDNITDNSNWSNKKEGPFGQSSSIWDNNME